jgi:Protein of unknown function (DUF433)
MSHEEILHDFPDLTEEDLRACLVFAAERERRPGSAPPRVRLLLDENVSPQLVRALADLFPESTHLRDAEGRVDSARKLFDPGYRGAVAGASP